MLYRTTGEGGSLRSPGRLAALARGGGLATLARAAPPPCPAFGGARGGCGPRTPWSWAGAPAPLRGPPGPVAPPPAGLPWCARPWPPSPPLGRCGPCPAALPPARACSRRGPWPLRGRWPRPGPLRSLGVAAGGAAAYRRAACARRRGAAAPPAGAAAAAPVPAAGGLAPPPAAVPGSGVWAGGLLSLAAPCRGRCAPAASRPAPPPRRAGAPSAAPCRAARLSPWAAAPPPSGGRLGRLRRPFSPPPPPGVGIIRPSACRQGLRKWPIRATLDSGPLARSVLINGARLPCGIIFVSPRKWLTSSNGCAIIGGARETPNRRHFGARCPRRLGAFLFF